MKYTLCLVLLILAHVSSAFQVPDKINVLIVDGQNNHQSWPKTTVMMKTYLENTGLFVVDVARTKYLWKGESQAAYLDHVDVVSGEHLDEPKADPDFAPRFLDYDVVISNFGWKAAPWPEETQKAFEEYVQNGGGFVSVHAADNSFPGWDAYNEMTGIGGWGGRNEQWGPYVYFNEEGERIEDHSPGAAGRHGKRHSFEITLREEHAITKGLPRQWLGAPDECYAHMRGPAKNMIVLATGEDLTREGGEGRHEPVLMALSYGDGRVFHTTLGHDQRSMEGVGFITTLLRGTEWAATGEVSQQVPVDFPTHDKVSSRPFSD
ncbi:ThuA domain-containing protein [Echinicola strongylocentroti]|uniref:ThuA domain-containing protein n=1 Tax=Echinicola strongylocentroti TaxID=1795355 RepID=A0A2Z4IGL0_9BACT|nr:ThuA domain-containing protein [Echinicola strongylocentroti]AWW29618.1 ThuA domain-containing protein [Echinicola strongylocentroti]